MKRKRIAILLAALLSVSPIAESAAVWGAEFSAGETTAEAVGADLDVMESDAAEPAESTLTDIWTAGEDGTDETDETYETYETEEAVEFTTGEETQEEVFVAEESEILTQAAQAEQGHGTYEIAYVTQEQYQRCLEGEDRPDVDYERLEDTTLTEALKGQNAGYCVVIPSELEGSEDLVIPEGLTVFVAYEQDLNLRSITPNGNLTLWGIGETEDTLEIRSGNGTVTFKDCHMDATLKGTGSNDTVVFYSDCTMKAIQGIENIHFGRDCWGVNVREASEFYNLYNDSEHDANDVYQVSLRVLGKEESKAPVFHKTFDWGQNTFTDEEGNSWEDNYKLVIHYYKTFEDSEEDTRYDVGGGFQAVKFDMADTDIIDMMNRIEVHVPDNGYAVSMDGKTRNWEDYVINIQRFQNCEGMSAEECFEALGKSDLPDGSMEWIVSLPDTEQAYRYMTADQKKYNTEGYYFVRLGTDAKVNGALTVPDGVKGIKYAGASDYNEETDTLTLLPSATFSMVNVPAGKKLALIDILVNADTITFSGAGTAELLDARLNAKVTADRLEISRAVVKELDCKELTAEENGQLVVKDYLSFEKAQIDPSFSIYAEPTSYLRLGEIDSEGFGEGDILIFTGQDKTSKAAVYFAGDLNLGRYTFTNNEGEQDTTDRKVILISCDEEKAKKVDASFTEDCFSGTYHYTDEENSWWGDYPANYQDESICLASVDKKLNEKEILSSVIAEYLFSDTNVWIGLESRLNEDGEWESGAVDGNKRYTFYWLKETRTNTKAYYQTADAPAISIASAQISAIKTQVYAGKAVKPSVTVTLNGKKLKSGTDYTVSYANNKKAGATATVTITGKGSYVGTVSQTFKIAAIPAKGKVYTVGDLKYTVTKSAYKNGTVSVYAPVKKTITSVSVPASVKISGYTFQVTAIGNKAFNGCTKLKKVTIGSKVTTIGKQAFYGCKSLTSITISSKVLKAVGSSALKGISAKAVIKVPSAKLSAYTKLLKGKGQKSSVKIKK